jgi:hypothetical protein
MKPLKGEASPAANEGTMHLTRLIEEERGEEIKIRGEPT